MFSYQLLLIIMRTTTNKTFESIELLASLRTVLVGAIYTVYYRVLGAKVLSWISFKLFAVNDMRFFWYKKILY